MRFNLLLGKTWVLVSIGCLFAVLVVGPVQAQDCPFEASEAVEDTLDPTGYYPLQVGNVWEYEQSVNGIMESLIRMAVIGDTLIDGRRFFVRERSWFYTVGVDSVQAATWSEYIAVVDSGFVEPDRFVAYPFAADFNTCMELGSGNLYTISGGYGEPIEIDGLETPGVKTIENLGGGFVYAHGYGIIRGYGDGGGLQELTYLKVEDVEYGEPINERVAIVAREPGGAEERVGEGRLQLYPNPVRGAANVSVELTETAVVAVHVYDLLGRRVATPLERTLRTRGTYTARWSAEGLAAGLYVVVTEIDGRRALTTRVVKR